MKTLSFEQFEWHDAELIEIVVDRRTPGILDVVDLLVMTHDSNRVRVRFRDCYLFNSNLNFGVIGEESILDASVHAESELLAQLRERWKSFNAQLESLKEYRIELNTTGGHIVVLAKYVELMG